MYNLLAQKYNIVIRHTFLEKGRTQTEGDSMHSVAERAARHVPISIHQWCILYLLEANYEIPNKIEFKYSYNEQFRTVDLLTRGRRKISIDISQIQLKQCYMGVLPFTKQSMVMRNTCVTRKQYLFDTTTFTRICLIPMRVNTIPISFLYLKQHV
nr:unnamed protein product [Callosobruchus analis]